MELQSDEQPGSDEHKREANTKSASLMSSQAATSTNAKPRQGAPA
jgi:hypothetical protein